MAIGPERPAKGGSSSDPRYDELMNSMPDNELFVKNSQNQIQGIGFKIPDMEAANTVTGVDANGNWKAFTFSSLAQQMVSFNSESMMRSLLGVEIPDNISDFNNDVGYITQADIPVYVQSQSNWNQTDTAAADYIKNKPSIPVVNYPVKSVNGNIGDVVLTIPPAQVSSDWNSISGVSQILNKPTIPSNTNQLTNGSGFVTSAQAALSAPVQSVNGQTGAVNIPVPAAQVNSDWAANTGVSQILNKPVLFSGAYADLTGKPVLFSGNYVDLTGKPTLFDGTWSSLTGKPTTFTPSSHIHTISDVTGLQGALDSKYTLPTGTTLQYVRGNGSLATFPTTISSFTNDAGYITTSALSGYATTASLSNYATTASLTSATTGLRKVETFLGTSDVSGNFTVTFNNTYSTPPDVQPQIIGGTFNQFLRIVSVSNTGCVINAGQRNLVTLLSVEVLLGATVALAGASITVQVTSRT